MHWFAKVLEQSGPVVTANRRLARRYKEAYAAAKIAAGDSVWETPSIMAWQDWLNHLFESVVDQEDLPIRLNSQQSQLLWERCLKKELGADASGISALVRLSRDAWSRSSGWQLGIREIARAAQNDDQRVFARVAGRYLGILERECWVDDAGIGALILSLLKSGRIQVKGAISFAGFGRRRPLQQSIRTELQTLGVTVLDQSLEQTQAVGELLEFDTPQDEQRAAGTWARERLELNPGAKIAIVVAGLENQADQVARQVREGAVPGWQYAPTALADAVNISYGKRVSDFPAIAIALLLLRWLVRDLRAADISLLMRSPILGCHDLASRTNMELALRQLPDRAWSPAMVTAQFRKFSVSADEEQGTPEPQGWLRSVERLSKYRRELPEVLLPSEWVMLFHEVLQAFLWPGSGTLNSRDFQLISRWRELLNEFARIELISAKMQAREAALRLELLAAETIFQSEGDSMAIEVMGPLEAFGQSFDHIWVTGLTTANWPPAGSGTRLISRRLQEKVGMPDSTPADTVAFATQILHSIIGSAKEVVCSFAQFDDDAEQSVSDLLPDALPRSHNTTCAPMRHASRLVGAKPLTQVDERVPSIKPLERLYGGAGTIQQQISDPIAAFTQGRLGARALYPQAVGIPPPMRGNLIHDSLYWLYKDLPASKDIAAWTSDDVSTRIDEALDYAFSRHERNNDAVLRQLLKLERQRVQQLLKAFIVVDVERGDFSIAGVEGKLEFKQGAIEMSLRFDRIDTLPDGSIAILDYKTGSKKQLLSRTQDIRDIQLFVYAAATEAAVSALALVNIDSREISFEGAGAGYSDTEAWPALLAGAGRKITAACQDMQAGDVRINIEQGVSAARWHNLLSRYTELRRDID